MKKVAIFTEGLSEQIFVAAVIRHLADQRSLFIKKQKLLGGRKFPTLIMTVDEDDGDEAGCDYYFLLIDCATDSRVVTAINESYRGLVAQGFDTIIGMRDLAPSFSRDDLAKLLSKSKESLPSDPLDPVLVVAVMEVETWFIAEITHFSVIDPSLTVAKIAEDLAVDLLGDAELIEKPSTLLNQIYALAGQEYEKSKSGVDRVVGALSFDEYHPDSAIGRAKSLAPLFDALNEAFSQPEPIGT